MMGSTRSEDPDIWVRLVALLGIPPGRHAAHPWPLAACPLLSWPIRQGALA